MVVATLINTDTTELLRQTEKTVVTTLSNSDTAELYTSKQTLLATVATLSNSDTTVTQQSYIKNKTTNSNGCHLKQQ